mgnify:CR=1 FL=1
MDDRIKVIHKKNEGVSIARNIGIKEASGEYILFVDSDDWIECNMMEVLYDKSKEVDSDIIMCGAYVNYKNCKINFTLCIKNDYTFAYCMCSNLLFKTDFVKFV